MDRMRDVVSTKDDTPGLRCEPRSSRRSDEPKVPAHGCPSFSWMKGPAVALTIAELFAASSSWAAPTGGAVTSGTAAIDQNGAVTNVNQSSNKATIDWQAFSVAPGETVNFNQPSASSVTLNRVLGNEQSFIQGAVNANGQVFIINSNGVLFAPGSQVNTGGLVATTLDISDSDFQAGNYVFKGSGGRGSIVNQGTLKASDGGYVALLGRQVSNQGTVVATRGTAVLAGGNTITLNFNGNSLVSLTVDEGALDALVENKQAIYADGGKVILTAKAAGDLLSAQVNTSGIIQARTLDDLTGAVEISAVGGTVHVSGTIDASAPSSGNGGAIQTRGNTVRIDDSAVITTAAPSGQTGTWLLESPELTVAPSGATISGLALGAALASNNVTISSTASNSPGNLYVNDAVAWSADTKLTLTATHDIDFNASITANGAAARLSLNFGGDYQIGAPITLYGDSAGLDLNGTAYTLIHSMSELAALASATGTASGNFALALDVDASQWSASNLGAASVVTNFSGNLIGLGHTVSHLTLHAPSLDYVGLIGKASNSTIRDLGLVDSDIIGGFYVGTLLGQASGAHVLGVYSSGTVTGRGGVGGLIGVVAGASNEISDCSSATDVTSSGNYAGGLIGSASQTTIVQSRATGRVQATNASGVGGLIGNATDSGVADSYATGDVTGGTQTSWVGGLIGLMVDSTVATSVTNSFATGNVAGGNHVGGLIGNAISLPQAHLTLDNTYATGHVTASANGNGYAGGLVGNAAYVDITNSHAMGNVDLTGTGMADYAGGLVGFQNFGSVSNSYASGNVTGNGQSQSLGGLVGYNTGSIDSTYATGNVSGGHAAVGGLVGTNIDPGAISNSSAKGSVSGTNNIGGLVGVSSGNVTGSSASGNVTGVSYTDASGTTYPPSGAGGLVGLLQGGNGGGTGTITNSSASGAVTGVRAVGGLVGESTAGSIGNSTASGAVNGGPGQVGALIGTVRYGTVIINSYWNIDTTGQSNAVGMPIDNTGPANIKNSMGLTNTQFRDVSHYLDGTIDQLLAARAAAAQPARDPATGSNGAAKGSPGGSTPPPTDSSPTTPSRPTSPPGTTQPTPTPGQSGQDLLARARDASKEGALQMAGVADGDRSPNLRTRKSGPHNPPTLASNIVVVDTSRYSATVQRIEVDGQVFDLSDADFAEKSAGKPSTPKDAPNKPKK